MKFVRRNILGQLENAAGKSFTMGEMRPQGSAGVFCCRFHGTFIRSVQRNVCRTYSFFERGVVIEHCGYFGDYDMEKSIPRLLISGTNSGCGKTTIFCSVLQALKNRRLNVAAFKCGPDYIDPMFHAAIMQASSCNLDPYFCEEWLPYVMAENAGEINLAEGAMGYYDGMAFTSKYSAYDVACRLNLPTVIVIDAKGSANSVLAIMQGFLNFQEKSGICGFILNRVTERTYKGICENWKDERAKLYGYFPALPEKYILKSRHLGLVTAGEIVCIREMMQYLAEQAEKTIDLDGLLALAQSAEPFRYNVPKISRMDPIRIAVAKDEAFCFYYKENLTLLQEMGADIVDFSPLHDCELPKADCIYLGGGYPELYADALSCNESMKESLRKAAQDRIPIFAECGGFMYLNRMLDGKSMAGVLSGECTNKNKPVRFGYIEMEAKQDCLIAKKGDKLRAHEFHYYDCTQNGNAFSAKRRDKAYDCGAVDEYLYAGFPHIHFFSNLHCAEQFYRQCLKRKRERNETDGN